MRYCRGLAVNIHYAVYQRTKTLNHFRTSDVYFRWCPIRSFWNWDQSQCGKETTRHTLHRTWYVSDTATFKMCHSYNIDKMTSFWIKTEICLCSRKLHVNNNFIIFLFPILIPRQWSHVLYIKVLVDNTTIFQTILKFSFLQQKKMLFCCFVRLPSSIFFFFFKCTFSI